MRVAVAGATGVLGRSTMPALSGGGPRHRRPGPPHARGPRRPRPDRPLRPRCPAELRFQLAAGGDRPPGDGDSGRDQPATGRPGLRADEQAADGGDRQPRRGRRGRRRSSPDLPEHLLRLPTGTRARDRGRSALDRPGDGTGRPIAGRARAADTRPSGRRRPPLRAPLWTRHGVRARGIHGRLGGEAKAADPSQRGRESTFSFVHTDDAGSAVVAALDSGATGIFNVADDEPAKVSEWLPVLARARGGKPPRSMPAALARPVVGPYGVAFMTELRGASNAKARAELGWSPSIASWREGFVRG